jgi:hypothetical protein
MVVTKVEVLGVPIFQHPDGVPCSLLNALQLSGDQINAEDTSLNAAKANAQCILEMMDNPLIYSRLSTDKALVHRLAKELDRLGKRRLDEAFLRIARGKNSVPVLKAMGEALGPKVWFTILNNVTATWVNHRESEDLEHLLPLIREFVAERDKRKGAATGDRS